MTVAVVVEVCVTVAVFVAMLVTAPFVVGTVTSTLTDKVEVGTVCLEILSVTLLIKLRSAHT